MGNESNDPIGVFLQASKLSQLSLQPQEYLLLLSCLLLGALLVIAAANVPTAATDLAVLAPDLFEASAIWTQSPIHIYSLKGVWHEIFDFRFFS